MTNFKIAIRYGLIWGVASIIYSLGMYLILGKIDTSVVLSILIFILGIGVMYLIGIKKREEIGGFITWKLALTNIWVGAMVSVILTTLFTIVLYNFIAPELLDSIKEKQIEMLEKFRGTMGDLNTDQQIEKLQSTNPFSFLNSLLALAGGILVYFVLSCLVALTVAKEDPNEKFNSDKSISDRF